jgi:hypothetical protein
LGNKKYQYKAWKGKEKIDSSSWYTKMEEENKEEEVICKDIGEKYLWNMKTNVEKPTTKEWYKKK